MLRGGRPLKRWRYVGVFGEELMACAALVQVGPARQSFWALYTRADGRLRERTRTLVRRRAVALSPGRMCVRDGDVLLDLALEEEPGIQARCPHGDGHGHSTGAAGERREGAEHDGRKTPGAAGERHGGAGHDGREAPGAAPRTLGGHEVWTRKQAGVRAHGTLALHGGSPRAIEALASIDDTAGYHARHTEWWWSAGVGTGADGAALAWNLVAGVNDPPSGSERAIWVDGRAHEVGPVRFAADLSEIVAADAAEAWRLSFAAQAVRRRREHLLLLSSDYTAPFGTFAGTLPGGIRLAHGLGVVEHHRAKW